MPRGAAARHRAPKERSVERRRARALLLGAVVFAALVLLTALPWTTLLDQHAQLTSASAQVNQLQAENQALAAQAKELSNRSTQAGLARQDYGLVEPGQKAYDILPAPGTAASKTVEAGHVPLDEPPVVPGSRRSEELLGVGVVSAPAVNTPATATTAAKAAGGGAKASGWGASDSLGAHGFWSRVGHSLEFWN
jgi:cell division protein FtsB